MALTFQSQSITRLAPGTLSLSSILGSSSYLVSNFTTTNDMSSTPVRWRAIVENITDAPIEIAIDGSGGQQGFASGTIRFHILTPQMGLYLLNTVLRGKYVNDVTLTGFHPVFDVATYNCKLRFPTNLAEAGEKISASVYGNVQMQWYRGSILGNSWDDSFDASFG